jgi:hypothetical protein
MRFKTLENVTRSQIENMDFGALEGLITGMEKEARAEEWRKLVLQVLDEQEAQIVKVVV